MLQMFLWIIMNRVWAGTGSRLDFDLPHHQPTHMFFCSMGVCARLDSLILKIELISFLWSFDGDYGPLRKTLILYGLLVEARTGC